MSEKTFSIYGRTYEVKIGCWIELDNGRGEKLEACEWWDQAEFAFRAPRNGPIHAVACNIAITGRTLRHSYDTNWIKVRITWVGDGEPDTHCSGWLCCNELSQAA